MFCSNCGKEISDKAVVCPNCGAPTELYRKNETTQQPTINIVNNNSANATAVAGGVRYVPKSKWVAFFLCLFLGWCGAHRFYVGKAGTGILYLFTGGLFGIGLVIDFIMILLGGFRDKFGQPLA